MAKLLILGGTAEALALAAWAADQDTIAVTTSLAGRTRNPVLPAGRTRSGGFGGSHGLADYLKEEQFDLVVDATHPFAAAMAHNAMEACDARGLTRLKLLRPAWIREPDDNWIKVADQDAAARALNGLGERVFLTSGWQGLEAFAACEDNWFLVRLIDPPRDPPPLGRYELILGRGPFPASQEANLMRAHRIDVLVSKDSGGTATYGKILAARHLALPVVMITRPKPPPGETVDDLEQAKAWIMARTKT
ncbi:MAG: cobalt-precorrin-6A reductase [Hyphomicrobiales bacterium]|nr:cobalt-precorrin-6A reductase [Hyphomicrobiales bacterium]